MIYQSKNDSVKGLHQLIWENTKYLYETNSREINDDIIKLLYEKLNSSDNNVEFKNESHPPIEYYKDKINCNITYNINNININTMPPKKPWNKLLDVVLTIVKLITLFLGLSSLGDSDDDSSDNNLRLQLA